MKWPHLAQINAASRRALETCRVTLRWLELRPRPHEVIGQREATTEGGARH
ncbi:MAG: hypothetical protein ACK6DS_05160 [Planctomycetota bacterium]